MSTLYPENTSYGSEKSSNGRIGFSKLRAVAQQNVNDLLSNTAKKSSGVPSSLQSINLINKSVAQTPGTENTAQIPTGEPVGEAFSDRYKNLQQYRNETGESLPTRTDQPWYTPETPNTKIANMPGFLGAGQYLTDANSANVANERAYIPEENKMILGGRDPRLYQIDHIIPLWAGGADTVANKEILTTSEHAIKSKIQAVPFTLMVKGIISPSEAKRMAIDWQGKDASGIPAEGASGGLIDENIAKEKYAEWNRVKKVTIKDVLKQVPEVLKSATKPLAAKTGEDPTEQFFKSLAGGFLSEASFGVLPYQSESTDFSSKAGGFVGKIAGNVVAFASLGGLIGEAGKIASKTKYLKSFANSAKIGDELFKGAQMTKEGAQVAGEAAGFAGNKIGIAVRGGGVGNAIKTGSSKGINNLVKNIKINSVLKTAGLMNAYGQIRITAPALVGLEKMPDLNQRFNQAMIDTAYGFTLGQAGHNIKGYAGVGAGALAIGLISGDDVENSTLDAFTMMALHGLGQGAANKRSKLPTLEEAMNSVADKTASDHIFNKVGVRVDKLTPDSAVTIREKLNKEREKLISNGDVDISDIAKIRLQDEVAIRQLEKGGMTTALRRQADIDDMSSIGDKLKNKEQIQDISTPDEVVQTVTKMEDHLFNDSPLEKTDGGDVPGVNRPEGRFPLTGIAEQISGGEPKKRVDYFFDAKDKGMAAKNVLLIERSELENFFKEINNANKVLKAKDIENNEISLMKHPENSVQAFGVVRVTDPSIEPLPGVVRVKGQSTPLDIVPLGWVARRDRIASIADGGRNKSFNQNTLNRFGEGSGADVFNPEYNKDLVAESIRKNKMKVLTASLNPLSTPRGATTNQPFIVLDINSQNWQNSAELNKSRIGQTIGDNVGTLVEKVKKTNDPQAVVSVINKIKEKNPDLGAAKIMKTMADKSKDPDTAFAADVLTTFEGGLNSGSVEKLKSDVNKKYGQILDDNTALQLMSNKNSFTAENAFDILYDGIKDGKANAGTGIMYQSSLMPLFDKISSNELTIDGIPVNSFYHKMPVVASRDLVLSGDVGKEVKTPEGNTNSTQTEGAPKEPLYFKYPTFKTEKKIQERDMAQKEGMEVIDNFDIHGYETNADILLKMKGQIDNIVNSYQWTPVEKSQVKDLLTEYAQNKINDLGSEIEVVGDNAPGSGVEQISGEKGKYGSEAAPNIEDYKLNPLQGANKNSEVAKATEFRSIYPDIYKASERNNPLASKIAGRLSVEDLTKRSSKTNKNSFANDIQESINKSTIQGKKNTALLWTDVLKEFDRLGKSSDWRNKEIDSTKFNENIKKLSSDTVTSGSRAGSAKTVNPEIANYEMDINVGRIDNLPEPLQKKYKELQDEGYGHVYSSSSMNTKAYKGKTSGESSYNMFKYIKEYVEKNDDKDIVKEIYGENPDKMAKALKAIERWREGETLTLERLGKIEQTMFGKAKPDIAKRLEERKIDLNKGVGPSLIEAGLSPISVEDFKEVPEFNNPLSHAIMSLSKYNINDLTEGEISKLSKSLAYTLWPSVRYSLKLEKSQPSIKKNDGKGGPGGGFLDVITNVAKDFSSKVKTAPSINYSPQQVENLSNIKNTVLGKISNRNNSVITDSVPSSVSQQQPKLDNKIGDFGHLISLVESSGGKNAKNKKLDQGEYGYVVGFTKGTYNDIKKRANLGDARYQDLLSNLDFSTPEAAKRSAVVYANFRNTLFDNSGKPIGKKYTDPKDIYINLYNATSGKEKTRAINNWDNVIKNVSAFSKDL